MLIQSTSIEASNITIFIVLYPWNLENSFCWKLYIDTQRSKHWLSQKHLLGGRALISSFPGSTRKLLLQQLFGSWQIKNSLTGFLKYYCSIKDYQLKSPCHNLLNSRIQPDVKAHWEAQNHIVNEDKLGLLAEERERGEREEQKTEKENVH